MFSLSVELPTSNIHYFFFVNKFVGFCVTGVIDSPDLPAGNPAKLTHAMDYNGGICSVTNGVTLSIILYLPVRTDSELNNLKVEKKPYAYYLPSGSAVCVHSCPTETNYEK